MKAATGGLTRSCTDWATASWGARTGGEVLAYLQRLSGYSRAQVTRPVGRWVEGQPLVKQYRPPEHAFARRYTAADVALLADVDRAMGTLSGPTSRPRNSNDNALVETKNGAVVRKVFGYTHIPQRHAARFNTFCVEYLNPFLNFHRPCLYATEVPDPKKPGRIKRVYRPADAMTPLDKLASLPEAARYLRQGITLDHL